MDLIFTTRIIIGLYYDMRKIIQSYNSVCMCWQDFHFLFYSGRVGFVRYPCLCIKASDLWCFIARPAVGRCNANGARDPNYRQSYDFIHKPNKGFSAFITCARIVLFAVFSTTPAAASHLTRFGLEAYKNRSNYYCRDSSVTEPLRPDTEVDGW